MDNEEISRLRERIANLATRHDEILRGFWDDQKHTFGQYGPADAGHHVTTSCTCALSFLEVPDGRLPGFLEANKAQFVEWLLSVDWKSESLKVNNPYTAPLALSTLLQLADGSILEKPRPKEAVKSLMATLQDSKSGAIAFPGYPPSGYLTYWTVRAMSAALAHCGKGTIAADEITATRRGIDAAAEWAEDELYKHVAYYSAGDPDRYDALQLGYAMAIVDFIRARDGRNPDATLLATGLKVFFASQLSNGLWTKGIPIFHYPEVGNVYPFTFETLTAVMRLGSRESLEGSRFAIELFVPHIEYLQRSLSWVESHELVHEGVHGWRSNNVLSGVQPQGWATAMALCFVKILDVLLQRILQDRLLQEFSANRFPKSSSARLTLDQWCPNIADSLTPLADGERQSLKKLLFDYLIEPRLPHSSPSAALEAANRLRWSAVFFGPPGTAKTTLATEIAKALSWPLVTIKTSDLLALGVDRMAHQAGLVFRKFEQLHKVVIFIDEVEEFVRTRSDEDRESRLTTTAMLTLIQSLRNLKRSILIVATNHVDKFDPAIIRPGRFDLLVLVKPPSVESKIQLWKEAFQAPEEAKLGDEVFPREADLVERFTFSEWSTFMNACMVSKTKAQLTADIIRRHLRDAEPALTIDRTEWCRWADRTSRIS